jgi:urate oxidase
MEIDIEIGQAAYGKDGVRVLTRTRAVGVESVRDACVGVRVDGDFLESYRSGGNAAILPSDTLRRHVLAEADRRPDAGLESLLGAIAARILAANPAVRRVVASAQARRWEAVGEHSFVVAPSRTTGEARLVRGEPVDLRGGFRGLELLMSTGSGFTGFMRDELTTQADASDRPLCGTLDADWTYAAGLDPPGGLAQEIAGRLVAAFADRPSNAVQQLLTGIGSDVLVQSVELAGIRLHFDSVAASPIPAALSAPGGVGTYELGVGAVGVTDVALRRA